MNVSVVIPNYNGKELLKKHLPHVLASLSKQDEVIIVDDASTDDSVQFLHEKYPSVRCIVNASNMRYAKTCNIGVEAAKNDIIVLLNNDVSPEKNFLKPLIKHFDDANIFAVGCLEKDNNGHTSGRSTAVFERGMLIHKRADNQDKHTSLWASGGSMAVRKSLWMKLGGMDVLFKPAYEEDRDLSYRAWKLGYVVAFEPTSVVLHQHETTNASAIGKNNLVIASYKNALIFYWKNITDTSLIVSHLCWLPYHLIIGGIRSNGLLFTGFIQAFQQLPDVMSARRKLKLLWTKTDKQVIESVEL